ncbi:acetyl-CoA carboxylase biotin carboxyl carrier protein [Thermophilibacter immobilis]|jgi:acetyl-CoA carboxylase biotin carboxyl carrier protein|uniref:Biotin carboxyl carrier protein of acetyl-CoA carboxylase n=1 Tax=Thermophilibacter immobilis TaxID=2779519 RepID=A0A7S7M9T1_9ACTN|nr:acetyl-CoA carboxylase biotin carboxyl carrier protein [Thermophilibacter immobilis]QOY60488.1 acetyl-CoA carboxylase biotin carboxyl carrier protein [Thermophilibacter immobilis]
MDTRKISEMAAVMEERGLVRVRVEEADGTVVELERERAVVAAPPLAQPVPSAPVIPAAPAPAPSAADVPAPSDDDPLDLTRATVVSAPMVGVFYASPSVGSEPFVHVGSQVKKGETLCVIEAMKVMNEVTAEADGEVVDICVKDGQLVEYGCCLMKLY